VFGLARKGRMLPGNDADFTLVDLAAKRTITHAWSKSRCGWTPFEGFEATGWPMATVVRGRFVMRDGALVGKSQGQPAEFLP
jgi:dihydroorotase